MKPRHNFIIDIIATVVYVIAANPLITGLAIHEWVGLGIIIVFIVHCAAHYDWILATIRHHNDKVSVANLILDIATLVVFMVVTVSGLMVSRYILPLFGLVAPGYFFWNPLHSISAKVLLALLLVHVVVHWKWVASFISRRKARKRASQPSLTKVGED